jgi:hypothetical protein
MNWLKKTFDINIAKLLLMLLAVGVIWTVIVGFMCCFN